MNNPNPINEADMLAYLRDVTARYAVEFPELRSFAAQASVSSVSFFGYKDEEYNYACASGETYPEAATRLRKQLGTAPEYAAKLREQAAKLIAEADKLEGAK